MMGNIDPDFDLSKIEEGMSSIAKDILKELENKTFVLETILTEGNPDCNIQLITNRHQKLFFTILKNLLHGFEHKDFREAPVTFKFLSSDTKAHALQFRDFLFNLAMWYPVVSVDYHNLGEEHIITRNMMPRITTSFIADYMDKFYTRPYFKKVNVKRASEVLTDANFMLQYIPLKFNSFIGLSIGIEELREIAKRYPEFEKGLYFRIDEQLQPAEQERQKAEADKRQFDIIENDIEYTTMKAMIATNAANRRQVSEFISVIGNKANNEGQTLSKPINGNYLTRGLDNVPYYYIGAIAGRKAQVINTEFMGSAGHMQILVAILSSEAKLSKTVTDCRTVNPIPIEIKSKEHLKKLDGRRYRFSGSMPYTILDSEKDEHLIGETLWFRSPCTCAAHDGICRECYGELYYTNKDLHSIGSYAAFEVINPVVQGLLSAKHTQVTNSGMLVFSEEFANFFMLETTDVVLNQEIEDSYMYSIVILADDIVCADNELDDTKTSIGKSSNRSNIDFDDVELDDEEAMMLNYYTKRFYVVKNHSYGNPENIECFEIKEEHDKELYMHDDFVSRLRKGKTNIFGESDYVYINMEDISLDEFIFSLEVDNYEVTAPMKDIRQLIHNSNHLGYKTYEEMCQVMLDCIIKSKFAAMSVHGELIIRQLIRKSTNDTKRPDFSRLIMQQDYIVLSVLQALQKNPSITTAMSCSYLKKQLINNNDTYWKRDPSDMDWFYKHHLAYDETELYYGMID